jgi:SAM-dependent methyltransferase
VTDLNLTDVATGCKAFRRESLLELDLEQDRFGFEFEVTAKAATAGWRIYEVGISYDGRRHRPARTFGWREVVRAVYCIGRYSSIGSRLAAPRIHAARTEQHEVSFDEADESLADTLDNLDDASHYAAWIVDLIAPNVGGDIVELGAGHGTMSERLRHLGHVTACEPSLRAAARLEERFAGASDVTVVAEDIAATMAGASFDSAVMINVLEHIPDDLEALTAIHDGLRPGGTLAVYVPAHEVLYSRFDRLIGHQRRYRRSTLTQALSRAGFEIVELRYVNLPGMLAWLVIARMLGLIPSQSGLLDLFDRFVVPVVRAVEDRWPMPSGASLLAIARRPDAD